MAEKNTTVSDKTNKLDARLVALQTLTNEMESLEYKIDKFEARFRELNIKISTQNQTIKEISLQLVNKASKVDFEDLLAEVESRTQGSRPRTQKKSEAKDSLSEDRHSRGQGQECSRPRPRTKDTKRKCSPKKKKKKVFTKIFQVISTKKRFPKNFSTAPQTFNFPKNSAVLEPRTGQFSRT